MFDINTVVAQAAEKVASQQKELELSSLQELKQASLAKLEEVKSDLNAIDSAINERTPEVPQEEVQG